MVMSSNPEALSSRPTYHPDQITAYLRRIHHSEYHLPPNDLPNLVSLTFLQQHQLAHIPFENLSLHYSQSHTISLDPDVLYQKYVEQGRGRGGYCMENNAFFGNVLRSLGFTVTSVGGRICDSVNGGEGRSYGGWSHMVNIVSLPDGKKYMVDVGFGGNGATAPLPLEENIELERIAPSEMRLIKSPLPQHTDQTNQRMWIYQVRSFKESDWVPQYCFTETEFLPQDYEIMNFWTSQSRQSVFTSGILMAKMVMDGETGKIVGQVTMRDGEVKRRKGEEVVGTRVCRSEGERIEVLRNWFGITLTGDEERGIRGLVTELKG
ncbi:MAG: hypothetical protein Q9222_003916 [Ikaeria aurantiellina]